MSHLRSRWLAPTLLCAGLSCNMYAVDGIILIDQNRALSGGVTPGDTPGFPVTISLSGSYRLSGNLTVPDANTSGIVIKANDVSIDLNGFSIIGPTVCDRTPVPACPMGFGIGVLSDSANITVANGVVRGMGLEGIQLTGIGNRVERVHSSSNGRIGIAVSFGVVTGNTVTSNGGSGIEIFEGGTASFNVSVGNGQFGYVLSCPTTAMTGNMARLNQSGNVSTFGSGCAFTGNAP